MGKVDNYEEKILECAYKPYQSLTPNERLLCSWEREYIETSFLRFLKWCRIVQPPMPGQAGGGVIPMVLWKHTLEVVKTLLKEKLISILKARQIGLSTIIAAYVVWYALVHVGANILLFSQGQDEAKELLQKCRNIYDNLPSFMKLPLDPDSREAFGFPVMKSAIRALPSTTSAGVGYTASILVWDEHAKHEYADQNFIHSKPTRDGGGQVISIFTADPFGNDNLATSIFEDALKEINDFKPLFFPWNVIPARDQEWYDRTRRNIPDRELAKLSPELYMAKNYPSSIEEALSLAESVVVFDKKVLSAMTGDTRGKVNENFEDIDNSICNIYKDYHVGNSYIASADIGWGVSSDFSVLTIMDVRTKDIVSDIMSNELPPEEFAEKCYSLLVHYHNPLIWPECNIAGGGRTFIKKLVELGYRKIGYRGTKPINWSDIEDNEVLRRIGFFTDDKARMDLFGELIPAINDYQLKIYNSQGLSQFKYMIRNANKNGKIEAVSGQHDDYVISVGICWLRKGDVKLSSNLMKPIKTLTYAR